MKKEGPSPKSRRTGIASIVAMLLSIFLAGFTQNFLENSFLQFQDFHVFAKAALFVAIFIPMQQIVFKFTDWLYPESDEVDR